MADGATLEAEQRRRTLLSIVVIGRNEGDRLQRCLSSISAMDQATFDLEVFYVDSGSTDGSLKLAADMGANVISLRPDHPSAALGRNAGWRKAKGEFILFLDGDTVLHPAFVTHSLPEFAQSQIGIVWGHRRELFPKHSIYNRILDLDWVYAPGLTSFCGGDALFRRSVLEATGGFDDTLVAGEEPELCRRIAALGFTILHVDRPMTGHDLAITRFKQYWKRCARAGHAFAEVSARFRGTESPFWEEDVRRNRNRFLVLLAATLVTLVATLVLRSVAPLLLASLSFTILGLRSAWKARWKSSDTTGLILYGFHSHLQHIPIFVGQLQYLWSKKRGQRKALYEYK